MKQLLLTIVITVSLLSCGELKSTLPSLQQQDTDEDIPQQDNLTFTDNTDDTQPQLEGGDGAGDHEEVNLNANDDIVDDDILLTITTDAPYTDNIEIETVENEDYDEDTEEQYREFLKRDTEQVEEQRKHNNKVNVGVPNIYSVSTILNQPTSITLIWRLEDEQSSTGVTYNVYVRRTNQRMEGWSDGDIKSVKKLNTLKEDGEPITDKGVLVKRVLPYRHHTHYEVTGLIPNTYYQFAVAVVKNDEILSMKQIIGTTQ